MLKQTPHTVEKTGMQRLNTKTLDHQLNLPNHFNTHQLITAVKQWFERHHLNDDSHYVLTKAGQKICFTGISEWHLTFDVQQSRSVIMAKALTYLPEVFESGDYKKVQPSNKDRSQKRAKFIRFHLYVKKVRIDDYLVTIRAKAGEYQNGKIIMLPKLSAYTFNINHKKVNKEKVTDLLKNRSELGTTASKTSTLLTDIKPITVQSVTSDIYDSVYFDDIQEQATFEILEIEPIPTTDIYRKQINALFRRYGL